MESGIYKVKPFNGQADYCLIHSIDGEQVVFENSEGVVIRRKILGNRCSDGSDVSIQKVSLSEIKHALELIEQSKW